MGTRKWPLAAVIVAVLAASAVLSGPARTAGAAGADGATLFRTKCATCHAADGSGNTAYGKRSSLRDLRSAEVQAQSDAQLYTITAKGKGKMPGYEASLGADACKALVAYMRQLKP